MQIAIYKHDSITGLPANGGHGGEKVRKEINLCKTLINRWIIKIKLKNKLSS